MSSHSSASCRNRTTQHINVDGIEEDVDEGQMLLRRGKSQRVFVVRPTTFWKGIKGRKQRKNRAQRRGMEMMVRESPGNGATTSSYRRRGLHVKMRRLKTVFNMKSRLKRALKTIIRKSSIAWKELFLLFASGGIMLTGGFKYSK